MGYEESIQEVRETISLELIRRGLELGAIRLNTTEPFLWASGYRMPIYNDNRTFLRDFQSRQTIAVGFVKLLQALECEPEWIAGTATAGIPHATTLADSLSLPLCYVRSNAKGHGLKNTIEGLGQDDSFQQALVVLIEDLISTGGSSIRAVCALRDAGALVPWCLAIFSYELQGSSDAFMSLEEPCTPVSLITYQELIRNAEELGYIGSEASEALREWQEDPFGWGESRGFERVINGS